MVGLLYFFLYVLKNETCHFIMTNFTFLVPIEKGEIIYKINKKLLNTNERTS